MAISEVYVDPSIAGNSGAGTSGDPYGDLQYAMDQTTLGTDGTRFNIKAGTDEILTAALDFTTHGTPINTQVVVFQGYTTTAGDGGIGSIEGTTNTVPIVTSTAIDYVSFYDMDLTSSSVSHTVQLDNACNLWNCKVTNTSTGSVLDIDTGNAIGCEFVSAGGKFFGGFVGFKVMSCYCRTTSTTFGISAAGAVVDCIFDIGATSTGNSEIVAPASEGSLIAHNTFKFTGTPGNNVWAFSVSSHENCIVANNYIEGFSGTSGGAIRFESGGHGCLAINNYYYNNTTNESDLSASGQFINGTSLGSSGIDSNFLPTSDLQALAYPTTFKNLGSTPNKRDVGAVQHTDSGGGTSGRQGLHGIESGNV